MRRRRRRNPLLDGWVCPRCGQYSNRHGRGGARACKAGRDKPHCPGLQCQCGDGRCYQTGVGRGWRRSPCLRAVCAHCGWEGAVRSRDFERTYGDARCPKSRTGWHHVTAEIHDNAEPDALRMTLRCIYCGAVGEITIHPVDDVMWETPERTCVVPQQGS